MLMQPIRTEAAIISRHRGPILSFFVSVEAGVCGSGRVTEVHIENAKEEGSGEALLGDVRSTNGASSEAPLKGKGKLIEV